MLNLLCILFLTNKVNNSHEVHHMIHEVCDGRSLGRAVFVRQPHVTAPANHKLRGIKHVVNIMYVKLARIHIYFTVYTRYTRHTSTLLTNATNRLGCSRRLHQTSLVGKHDCISNVPSLTPSFTHHMSITLRQLYSNVIYVRACARDTSEVI